MDINQSIASRISAASNRNPKSNISRDCKLCLHCGQYLSLKTFKRHERLYKKSDGTWICVESFSYEGMRAIKIKLYKLLLQLPDHDELPPPSSVPPSLPTFEPQVHDDSEMLTDEREVPESSDLITPSGEGTSDENDDSEGMHLCNIHTWTQ